MAQKIKNINEITTLKLEMELKIKQINQKRAKKIIKEVSIIEKFFVKIL